MKTLHKVPLELVEVEFIPPHNETVWRMSFSIAGNCKIHTAAPFAVV